MIVADCRSPNYGLGNRINVLCAAYAGAAVRGMPCSCVWESSADCQAEWSDLFLPLPDVEMLGEIPKGAIVNNVPTYLPKHKQRHKRQVGVPVFTAEYWEAWQRCAKNIRLLPELEVPDKRGFTAVHVRALHQRTPVHPGWWRAVPALSNLFLSVDDSATFRMLQYVWPNAWWLNEPTATQDRGENRGLEDIKAAARDMVMLSRADRMIVVGGPSSFRNFAHLGFAVPLLRCYHGTNP